MAKRRYYSQEFKDSAVKLVTEQGYSLSEAAVNPGINFTRLRRWKKAYPVSLLCEVMQVSRSGYYAWKNGGPSARQREYDKLIPIEEQAHKDSEKTYGARRMAREIEEKRFQCGRTKAPTVSPGEYCCQAEEEI